jgi:DNA-binding transcriptional LysR family regulator
LGAELFMRDRRHTELTPAGEQLVDETRPLLASADALLRQVRAAGQGVARFTIGFMPGITVTGVARLLRERHPGLDVRMLRTGWHDQVDVLHDARADVGIVRLPIEPAGLEIGPLFTEPRVVVVASAHRLAGKEAVRVADLRRSFRFGSSRGGHLPIIVVTVMSDRRAGLLSAVAGEPIGAVDRNPVPARMDWETEPVGEQ